MHNTDRCALLLLYLSECCDIVGIGLYHNKYKPKKPNIERATLVCEKWDGLICNVYEDKCKPYYSAFLGLTTS